MPGPNYRAVQGQIDITQDGKPLTTLRPEKRFYPSTQSTMTEASIDSGFTRDLYVSLGEPVAGGAWIVRVYYKPFVDWIWGGCFVMALGGLIAATDRRYRSKARQSAMAHGAGVAAT
jgi:cytochrome c-type biogenesis protein CcmF